jgi:hypothetical protein
MEENRKQQWDASYDNKDNFVWYPNEEVICFVSTYIKKKTGIDYVEKNFTFLPILLRKKD